MFPTATVLAPRAVVYRPIAYRPDMSARARQGSKRMTRRLLRPLPVAAPSECLAGYCQAEHVGKWAWETQEGEFLGFCPYGQVGDRLWIKEEYYSFGYWTPTGIGASGRLRHKFVATSSEFRYPDNAPAQVLRGRTEQQGWYKRLARFMPRAASRTTLEITAVGVERLSELSEADALADGGWTYGACPVHKNPLKSFRLLFAEIHGEELVATDPYLWVISFRLLA